MTQHIQHQIDQLLLEQGEYLPLELLLREGRLMYADYEAWRNSEMECLDEALFGDPETIQQQLTQAEEYLQRLGWQAETITYQPWSSPQSLPESQPLSSSTTLCFSENRWLDQCFHRRYYKPQDQPQMDMFTDDPATSIVNGITQALSERKPDDARRLLERLYDTAPDHIRLGELEHLVEAAESLTVAVSDAAADMQLLRETLTPLADTLLGKDSRNLLIPLWRRLSDALLDRPYEPARPELHRSFTASQAMDWEIVREAVKQEVQWRTDAALLLRHARACDHLHQQAAALQSWFRLCWRFPEQGDALESSSDCELRQHWMEFLELEPELPVSNFPAWLLLIKPGLSRVLPEPANNLLNCPDSYCTVYQLQRMDSPAGNDDAMALRARLKQEAPPLFQHFLERVGK